MKSVGMMIVGMLLSVSAQAASGQDARVLPACNLKTAESLSQRVVATLAGYSIQADNVVVRSQLSQTGVDGSLFKGTVSVNSLSGKSEMSYDVTIANVGGVCVLSDLTLRQGD